MGYLKNCTYVEEEGPKRGFSLNGWKENLPRNPATQSSSCLGQLLKYMTTTNITILATTNKGINQEIHGVSLSSTAYEEA